MLSDEQIDELLNKLARQTIGINVLEQHRRIVQSWYAAQHSVEPTVLCAGHPEGSIAKEGICQECGLPIPHSG